ncbi:MAG: hypothetical protein GF347_02175 [Candidatus Moranbacteria bacterium]|nr:hypothetical protein [Candidatus Moranbacteria bacterium]
MTYQHQKLAAGDWKKLSFIEQMANIGSEVNRIIIWKNQGNDKYAKAALFRALELIDLSKEQVRDSRLKELNRMRELLLDYFMFDNQYSQTDKQWQDYFLAFGWAARLKR